MWQTTGPAANPQHYTAYIVRFYVQSNTCLPTLNSINEVATLHIISSSLYAMLTPPPLPRYEPASLPEPAYGMRSNQLQLEVCHSHRLFAMLCAECPDPCCILSANSIYLYVFICIYTYIPIEPYYYIQHIYFFYNNILINYGNLPIYFKLYLVFRCIPGIQSMPCCDQRLSSDYVHETVPQ